MATFTINFEGIICHVGPDAATKDRSIVVADPKNEHQPQIVIPAHASIPLNDEDTVTFDLPKGPAKTDSSFRGLVPDLTSVIDKGAILPDALNGVHKTSDGVIAFIELPGGTLSVPEIFDYPADFAFKDTTFAKKQCVGKGVALTIEDGGKKVKMTIKHKTGSPNEYEIPSGSTIVVGNVSSTGSSAGEHFGLYLALTDATEIALPEEDKNRKCKGKTRRGIFTLKEQAMKEVQRERGTGTSASGEGPEPIPNPDCTNSAWP